VEETLVNGSARAPGRFAAKSAEVQENKRVEFLLSAKECKKMHKSAQECERKGVEYSGEY